MSITSSFAGVIYLPNGDESSLVQSTLDKIIKGGNEVIKISKDDPSAENERRKDVVLSALINDLLTLSGCCSYFPPVLSFPDLKQQAQTAIASVKQSASILNSLPSQRKSKEVVLTISREMRNILNQFIVLLGAAEKESTNRIIQIITRIGEKVGRVRETTPASASGFQTSSQDLQNWVSKLQIGVANRATLIDDQDEAKELKEHSDNLPIYTRKLTTAVAFTLKSPDSAQYAQDKEQAVSLLVKTLGRIAQMLNDSLMNYDFGYEEARRSTTEPPGRMSSASGPTENQTASPPSGQGPTATLHNTTTTPLDQLLKAVREGRSNDAIAQAKYAVPYVVQIADSLPDGADLKQAMTNALQEVKKTVANPADQAQRGQAVKQLESLRNRLNPLKVSPKTNKNKQTLVQAAFDLSQKLQELVDASAVK